MANPDTFELNGLARYTPDGGATFHLRATMAGEVFARRISVRKRPYLDRPAPCDDTGVENDTFDVKVLFASTDTLPGVSEAVYPHYHARFMRETRVEGTATFYFPGRGEKRVRLARRTSEQNPSERNAEMVTLSLVEDGEDERAGADTFNLSSAKSAGPVVVRQFSEAARMIGIGGDLLAALESTMALLEAAVNSPFDSAALIPQRAARVLDICKRIRRTQSRAIVRIENGFSPLLVPGAGDVLALLSRVEDVAAQQASATYGTATVRPRRFTRALSIFEIATLTGQPVEDLIALNATLPLFGIPPGVEVLTRAA